MLKKGSNRNPDPLAAAFLNPKGRVLCDVPLIQAEDAGQQQSDSTGPPKEDSLLLDLHPLAAPSLLKLLKQHRLRLPLLVEDVSKEFEVIATTAENSDSNNNFSSSFSSPSLASQFESAFDPRTKLLGKRMIVQRSDLKDVGFHGDGESDLYTSYRYSLGVPEGPLEIVPGKALPTMMNLDLLNFIDYTKGCYSGQELTIRTFHRGTVRKRVGIVELEKGTDSATESKLSSLSPDLFYAKKSASKKLSLPKDAVAVGEIIASQKNFGLATISLPKKGEWGRWCMKSRENALKGFQAIADQSALEGQRIVGTVGTSATKETDSEETVSEESDDGGHSTPKIVPLKWRTPKYFEDESASHD